MTSRISPPRNSAPPRPPKTFAKPGGSGGEITDQSKRPKLAIDPKKKKPRDDEFAPGSGGKINNQSKLPKLAIDPKKKKPRDDEFAPGSGVKLGDGTKGPKIPPPPPPPGPGSGGEITNQDPLPRLLVPKK